MDLESLATELKMLAGRDKLTPPELERAKNLMIELKQLGMANAEMTEFTGSRWSESSVKGYTKGVKSTDPQSWKSTAALFSEMLSKNLSLTDVSQAMSIATELAGMNSSLDDVVSLIDNLKRNGVNVAQLKEAIDIKTQLEQAGTSPGAIAGFVKELEGEGMDVPAFISFYCEWHEAGLTLANARSALSYKAQLEQASIDINKLSQIVEASGKFGSSAEVLGALFKYGSLVELDQELQKRQQRSNAQAAEIESHSHDLDNAGRKLEKLRQEIATREKSLAIYERLKAIGFDEKTLAEIARVAQKYGKPPQVLMAINHFGGLAKIKAADLELSSKIKRKRESLKNLDKQRTELKEPVELCKKLLERKFGLTTIQMIDGAARKYGDLVEIIKAIEKYGALMEIDKKAAQANVALAEIDGKIAVLRETYALQNARNTTILDQFEILNAKAIEVGRAMGNIEEQIKKDTSARDILNLLQNPISAGYEQYLPLVLVTVKSINVWAMINKDKFKYASLVNSNLQDLARYLGGS